MQDRLGLTGGIIVTIQPFREEIDRVIATYVMDGAPRELNLSARERKQLLIALSHTTHPTAFRQVAWSVESTLRMQAHPNFIRCEYEAAPSSISPCWTHGILRTQHPRLRAGLLTHTREHL